MANEKEITTGLIGKYRITRRNCDKSLEVKGICTKKDREIQILTTEGSWIRTGYDVLNIEFVSATKMSPETRQFLNEEMKIIKEKEKLNDLITETNKKIQQLNAEEIRTIVNVVKSAGFMSNVEFENAIYENLKNKCGDWKVSANLYDPNKKYLQIYRDVYIEKYCRDKSFLYEEYDGTMQFYDECEKDENYKKILDKYRVTVPIKGYEKDFTEYLSLGDKDWLVYYQSVRIPVNEFTKEELAKILKKM